jgi:hypothetical protein
MCEFFTQTWGLVDRRAEFEKTMAAILAKVAPNKSSNERQGLIREYLESKSNKAQAVQLENGVTWRATEYEDATAAADGTLEGCQLHWAGTPCVLVAVNDEVVAEGDQVARDMPKLNYAGEYDVAMIPAIRLVTRKRPDVQNYDKAIRVAERLLAHAQKARCLPHGGRPLHEPSSSGMAQGMRSDVSCGHVKPGKPYSRSEARFY